MSYYYENKYKFSHHGLMRIKSRLHLEQKSDAEVRAYCLKLIEASHEIIETKDITYIKVNQKELYFVIENNNNLIVTLRQIKPEKMLDNLEE